LLLSTDIDALNAKLDDVAHKLKLQIYDTTTGVYGFESKQKEFGIETIRAEIHVSPSLGLELTEVAQSQDDRGLVLVSGVSGHAAEESKIQVGDTIIGVFSEPDFKETTTAYAYEDTMDILNRAKQHALDHGNDKISLELNRLVSRSTVKVIVEDGKETKEIEALAGDNLRLLLMHHHMKLYDENTHRLDQPNLCSDCGGEGICGTCLVAIREGMNTLNKPPPQEESIMRGRPRTWRAACKTVVGAHNEPGATVRIHLRPQTSEAEDLHLHP
jgi:ferredoxin